MDTCTQQIRSMLEQSTGDCTTSILIGCCHESMTSRLKSQTKNRATVLLRNKAGVLVFREVAKAVNLHNEYFGYKQKSVYLMACVPFPGILETASNLKRETGLMRWSVLSMPWPSERALFSTGSVSGNTHTSRATSRRARVRANSAGYWKAVKESPTPTLLPHREKAAPIVGPRRKPTENAMAITACKEK